MLELVNLVQALFLLLVGTLFKVVFVGLLLWLVEQFSERSYSQSFSFKMFVLKWVLVIGLILNIIYSILYIQY